MKQSSQSLLHAANDLAGLVAATAMQWYRRNNFSVETKSDGSPVTIADREGERAARNWLEQRFPRDGILGEEFGAVRASAPRRWIIDPIDGTKAFVRGVPLWGTLVAVCDGDEVLAGAACYPAVDEVIAAAPGEGCWWNGERARVSTVSSLASCTALVTDSRFPQRRHRQLSWERLGSMVSVCRTWGDCYGYLLVATGRAEVMVDDVVNVWDAAAMKPIIEEAGGVFTSWRGESTAFGGDVIATNAAVADAARNVLLEKP